MWWTVFRVEERSKQKKDSSEVGTVRLQNTRELERTVKSRKKDHTPYKTYGCIYKKHTTEQRKRSVYGRLSFSSSKSKIMERHLRTLTLDTKCVK